MGDVTKEPGGIVIHEENTPATVKVKKEPISRNSVSDDSACAITESKCTQLAGKSTDSTRSLLTARLDLTRSGQQIITSFFSVKDARKQANKPNCNSTSKSSQSTNVDEKNKPLPIDQDSLRGVFGWSTLDGVHIPFILRQGDKYTAVRVIERSLLKKYLQALPPDVYSCTYIKSYFITDNEAKLLNEINMKHCDRQFGQEHFTTKDLVVQLSDVDQLYKFLSTCYGKLIKKSSLSVPQSGTVVPTSKCEPCGIVKIDGTPVPYVTRDEAKYVPLSLFEAQMHSLEAKAEKLEHWELAYLKFCCRVANVGYGFLERNVPLIVSLDDVKQLVDDTVSFVDWWPSVHTNYSNQVSHDGEKKRMLSQQPRAISAVSNHYEDVFRKHLHPVLNQKMAIYTPLNSNSESKLATAHTVKPVKYVEPTTPHFPHGLHGIPPAHMPTHNPQPYIFNGQWWGPLVSRSLVTTSSASSHQTISGHSEQRQRHASLSGSSQKSIYDYLQGLQKFMTSDGWPVPFQSQDSMFSKPSTTTSFNQSNFSTGVIDTGQIGYTNWSLENVHHANRRLPVTSCHATSLAGALGYISDKSSHNGKIQHGKSGSLENSNLNPGIEGERGFLLAQHLARIDEALHKGTALHQHVVAPTAASNQCLVGKMTSPKPAHLVPACIASDLGACYHSLSASQKPVTSQSFSTSSKLQELLQANEPNVVKRNQLQSLAYEIKEVVMAGARFCGVNFVAEEGGSILMIPVKEIELKIKPHVAVHACEHIIRKFLKMDIFECNRGLSDVLRNKLKYSKDVDWSSTLSLVRAEDLRKSLSQLIGALTKLHACDDRASMPVAKKARHMGVSI